MRKTALLMTMIMMFNPIAVNGDNRIESGFANIDMTEDVEELDGSDMSYNETPEENSYEEIAISDSDDLVEDEAEIDEASTLLQLNNP